MPEDQLEISLDKRTKAMLEIANRHIKILEELVKSHKGLDLQLEVLAEHARFIVEVQAFMGQKFQDGGIVQAKYEPVTVNVGERAPLDFGCLTKFLR